MANYGSVGLENLKGRKSSMTILVSMPRTYALTTMIPSLGYVCVTNELTSLVFTSAMPELAAMKNESPRAPYLLS